MNRLLTIVDNLNTQRDILEQEYQNHENKPLSNELQSDKFIGLIDAYSIVINRLLSSLPAEKTEEDIILDTIEFTHRQYANATTNSGWYLREGFAQAREHLSAALLSSSYTAGKDG